jgi:hypothetical protein
VSALFWNSSRRSLVEGNPNPLSDLKVVIAGTLTQLGFTDIRRNELEVAGNRNGSVLSIAHFPTGPNQWFEVVMSGGADFDATKQNLDEVVTALHNIHLI